MDNIEATFDGIEVHGNYKFARIKLMIGREPDIIGSATVTICAPLAATDQPLQQTIDELLAVTNQTVQHHPLLEWMQRQREAL